MKKTNSPIFFQPTFGNRPEVIIGRDGEISDFIKGLQEPTGSRDRCTLLLGQRGMGKTALLLELADRAKDLGFITARVTAHESMPETIIEQLQLQGSSYFKNEKHITGVSAGALGFSFGLSFSEAAQQQFGFRTKLSMLCDKLEEKGKGVLILIDEVHTSPAMREVAASYQELVGEQKNIAIVMAGLPHAVSGILNDKVLTFLNRAKKMNLGLISPQAIKAYYEMAFNALSISYSDKQIEQAAEKAHGMPYLMQLIGYYLVSYATQSGKLSKEVIERAEAGALRDMDDNVFRPILSTLSDNDLLFLNAMAEIGEKSTIAELQKKLKKESSALQPYRKRLIDAGIIESPRRGELVFAVPYLSQYLKDQ